MALRLSHTHNLDHEHDSDPEFPDRDPEGSSSEDENDDGDLTWDDWQSDSLAKRPCRSLFEDKILDTVQEAIQYDEATHGFSLSETTSRLGNFPGLNGS